ncbi:MAG: T9SS type A sorting domain-containing protein [Chitinivibrionales bacterium]|nr:T9SS type A sorting domain-containing protein [Chitinivibrionales bacterium]
MPQCITVYNSAGVRCRSIRVRSDNTGRIDLDDLHLPSGIYFVRVRLDHRTISVPVYIAG